MAKKKDKSQVSCQIWKCTDDNISEVMKNFKLNTGGSISKCEAMDILIQLGKNCWTPGKKPRKKKG